MRRRSFLAAAGAAALIGPWVRRSRAATFGAFPGGTAGVQLPDGVRARRVLEVFLYGGLSCWETLYFVRAYGAPDDPLYPDSQYYALAADNAAALASCGAADRERPFAVDALGASVELGPFAARLWQRSDVVARMRLVVQRHALLPHEAAVPQALTGRPIGQPAPPASGAHPARPARRGGDAGSRVAARLRVRGRRGVERQRRGGGGAGRPPGRGAAAADPDRSRGHDQLLDRGVLGGDRAGHDALVAAYADQYAARLTWPGRGRVRSRAAADAASAFATQRRADAIHGVLRDDLLAPAGATACGRTAIDFPQVGLAAAAALLTHPTEPASYVCVVDSGLVGATGGSGYDTTSTTPPTPRPTSITCWPACSRSSTHPARPIRASCRSTTR